MPRITIVLSDETDAKLRKLSERTEINVSLLSNIAIKELLRHPEKMIGTAARTVGNEA